MTLLTADKLEPTVAATVTSTRNGRSVVIPRGTVRALLRAGARDRLETIGLTIGERTAPPEGTRIVAYHWERDRDGVAVMVIDATEPIPEPTPDPVLARIEALEAEVDEIKSRE